MLRAAIRHPPPRRPWSASRGHRRAPASGPTTTSPANVVDGGERPSTTAGCRRRRTRRAPRAPAPVRTQPATRRCSARPRRWPARRRAGPPSGATRVAAHAGAMAATMVTSNADGQRRPRRSAVSTAGEVVGISTPISVEQRPDARGQPDAEQQARAPRTPARPAPASTRTPAQHLAAGRADGAQQRHLAPSLRDQHVEGVPDDERARPAPRRRRTPAARW